MAAASFFPRNDALAMLAIAAASCALVFAPAPVAILVAGVLALAPLAWYAFPSGWLPLFLGAVILLPPLPIALGDSGPHASVLLAGIGLLAGLARLQEWRLYFSLLNGAFVALLGVLLASLGFALIHSGPAIAAGSAARLLLFAIGIYVYFSASQGPDLADRPAVRTTTRALFWVAFAAAGFGCVDFLFQLPAPAGFEPQFLWLDSGIYRRAQGLFYEASTLGNFCTFFVVMAAAMLAEPRERRWLPTPALWAGVVMFASAMLLSFSRASVLACGVALVTLALLERRRWQKYQAVLAIALLLPVAIGAFTLLLPEVAGGYWARFGSVLDNALDAPDRVLSGRLESWRILGGFIAGHPWQTAFGIGYKTLPYTEYLGRPVVADNAYLSMLVECGVAGLAALLALNAAILGVAWRALRKGSFHGKWIFCFWVAEMFQMLSGDILTYWRVLPIYFWVLAQAARDADASPASRPI